MYNLDAMPSEEMLATLKPKVADNWRVFRTALPDFKALPDLTDINIQILWSPGKGFLFEPDVGQFEDSDPDSPWETIEQAFTYMIKNEDDDGFVNTIEFLEKYAPEHLESLKAKVTLFEVQ